MKSVRKNSGTRIRTAGRRLQRMRAARLWREGSLTQPVRKYIRQRFSSVCHAQ